ncbi:DEAD/DEAH box helicase [Paenibacillus sp. J5C_2022]|uniref:DEAD/DEAH box helicase n=1 Tax=Paenibacillus sp. J5C2022 TaxID=2977129 RepID=UPI0021D3D080|nr:DEAD/DEAH box helicase [Paenibacillus sp. J5C2022]MCU6710448.1 DEAD/DEAH box helicase [Paenibacillus sp. J5C2022]
MRRTADIRELNIDGVWNGEGEQRGMLLSPTGRKEPEGKLRSLLFAWHRASWYGADIEEVRIGERTALRLSPLQAMDYLSDPAPVALMHIRWSERLLVLMRIARSIRESLLNGWFAPDWRRWNEESRCWRMEYPESSLERRLEWESLLEAADRQGDRHIELWLGDVVEEWIEKEEDCGRAWREVVQDAGESVVRHKAASEEDWLIAIGFQQDTLPFKVALQLSERGEEGVWPVQPVLQSRAGGAWIPLDGQGHPLEGEVIPEDWMPYVPEKLDKEQSRWLAAVPYLEDEAAPGVMKQGLDDEQAWQLLEHGSVTLLESGCPVMLPAWWEAVRSRKLRVKARMKSSVGSAAQPLFGLDGIVQFDWKLALGGIDVTEAEFMELVSQNRRLVQVGGQWVHLDPHDVALIRKWLKRVGKRQGLSFREVLQMHLQGGGELDLEGDLEAELKAEVELNEHLASWITQLQNISGIPLMEPPASFRGELRPYQQQGMSWLLFLRRYGLGGILADDMGLGKTIQFMAYLSMLKEQGAEGDAGGGPSLLICPTSVIGNWEKELERFTPHLRVHLHYGSKRSRGDELRADVSDADLVITSYALALLDQEDIRGIDWNTLCLDEAQNVKNVYTKQSAAIRRLSARHRIAMTGTPMENRLTELWSIYDFTNPGYLGSLNEFRRAVVAPIERTKDEALIKGLQRWVQPFMLRRVKKDPAIQLALPDKIESKSYIALTAEQGALYENIVSDLMEKLAELPPMQRRGLILATLTKLKQVCGHPALLLQEKGARSWEAKRSGKMARLLELCDEIVAEGERCLIFTQYVEMGEQLRNHLERQFDRDVPYLHGGVPKGKRDEMIEAFQKQEEPGAFVLSLKAGGIGLNLTAANHVIHFDRWWNPAVENQATDRAFRIGQTRQVQVHKFITLGTLEEKIDEMIEGKQSLNDQIVGQSENWITEMGTEELRELFALRETWLKG